MSCKYCSAIGEVKSFLDDPSKWCSANEFGKKVREFKEKEEKEEKERAKYG